MQRILSRGLMLVVLAGILYACNLVGTPTNEPQGVLAEDVTTLELAVQAQSGTYNAVGQVINYQYIITNKGTSPLVGPVTVTDNKTAVTCPAVNTVGNNNDNFDNQEIIICTSSYAITQTDLNTGSVISTSTASAGGTNSNTVTTTVRMTLIQVLELTSSANPATYNNSGQVIALTYNIRNTGANTLGPAQFSITNDRLGNVNCGAPDASLATGASISCSVNYTTSEADRNVTELAFNSTASGGGATTIQQVQTKVTNTAPPGSGSGNYTRGSTIKHDVQPGEWMLQITRCYGADLKAVIAANPQIINPALITPDDVLTIPNIGSNGNIYGPPCVIFYPAQANDTWNSIATNFNADMNVLLLANKNVSLGGGVKVRVPKNSANGTQVPGQNEPIRINFPPGSDKVTLAGTVTTSKGKDRYVLTAQQGQMLSVTLTAPTGGLELAVLPVSATALKFQNATLTFNGTIPANGDYYIDVVNVTTSDRQYTLEVVLSTPVAETQRVVDINPGAPDSNPSYMTVFNNMLYFGATGLDNAGNELWRYDAATNSVNRVKDIFPGAEGSNPSYLAVYNGALYFGANGNDGAGVELWRFNGSDVGRLTDINGGAGNANPAYMTVFNDHLYFSASSSDGSGVELWQTDGNTVGRVADIYAGAGNSNPSYLAVYNGALYFAATSNDGKGTEIWKFDGTNVSRVTDINPEVGNANPAYLTVFNGALYFSANANDGAGTELWKYDGTNASRAADINPGAGDSIPAYLTVYNGALYFSANGNDGAGYELWKFDGTTASRASDVNKSGDSLPSFLAVYNDQLYFQANGGDGTGRELWKYTKP